MLQVIKNILNSQLYAISLYARQIAGTLVLFIIARYLSVYDFGLFSSYKNIAAFCFMFANLGFADYILVSSQANVKEVKLKISLFLLNAINIAILIALGSIFFNLESHLLFTLIVIRSFFDGVFFALILPYFQATKTFNTIAKINIFYALGISVIAIASYILKLSLIKFLLLNIGLGLFNFIQCSYFAKINYLLVFNYLTRLTKKIDKTVINYSLVEIACIFYIQIQALYVSTFLPKEDAALFFSAFTLTTIITLFVGAQKQKLIPEILKTSVEVTRKILKSYLINSFILIFLVFVVFCLFGKNILALLYGQVYYQNANYVLLLLTIANFFTATIVIVGSYLTAKNKVHMKTPLQIESIFVAIISLFLFKIYGIYGATYSYIITALYLSIRYIMTVNNEINKELGEKND